MKWILILFGALLVFWAGVSFQKSQESTPEMQFAEPLVQKESRSISATSREPELPTKIQSVESIPTSPSSEPTPSAPPRVLTALEKAQKALKEKRFTDLRLLLDEEQARHPTSAALIALRAELLVAEGRLEDAIQSLNLNMTLVINDGERFSLLERRNDLILKRLQEWSEAEAWPEILTFLDGEPAMGSRAYYAFQLWAARAHVELFNWDQAESSLQMALFDDELSSEVDKIREEIWQRSHDLEIEHQGLPHSTKLRVKILGNAVIVPVAIGNAKLQLLLDTGASITMLDLDHRRSIDGSVSEELGKRVFSTANGRMEAEVVNVDDLILGEIALDSIEVSLAPGFRRDSGIDGLLGMNVLKHFDFKIDAEASQLLLEPK